MASHFHRPPNKWDVMADIMDELYVHDSQRDKLKAGMAYLSAKTLSNLHHYIVEAKRRCKVEM